MDDDGFIALGGRARTVGLVVIILVDSCRLRGTGVATLCLTCKS